MIGRLPAARLSTGLLVVLALALGQWLDQRLPQGPDAARPFEETAAVGDPVTMRSGTLEVTSVDGATQVFSDLAQGRATNGVFVVVEFTFTPRGESSGIAYGSLHDNRGRDLPFFGTSSRSSVTCPSGPVGVASRCLAVVEADPATVPGASIALGPDASDERYDSMAVLPLRVSAEDVDGWTSRDEPLRLPAEGPLLDDEDAS